MPEDEYCVMYVQDGEEHFTDPDSFGGAHTSAVRMSANGHQVIAVVTSTHAEERREVGRLRDTCGWNPIQATIDCDWDRACPTHGELSPDRPTVPFDPARPAPPGGMKHRTAHGYIIAGPDDRGCCVIHEMCVDPEHRGLGEGRILVDCVRAWAREQGLGPIVVHCSPGNADGQAFYAALGMRAVAIVYQDDLDDGTPTELEEK